MKVQGKIIVVTGGGNGIGRELVLALLLRGARVAAVDIQDDALRETAELAGVSQECLSLHAVNITEREAVLALPSDVIQAHGAVDGVINYAGIIQPFVKVHALSFQDIERVMNVNFWGVVNITKAFLPHLLQRPEAHIVNISSMGGFLPVPGQSVYGASKAAVKLLTEGLHSELLDTPVHVTVVFPGATETNISANSGVNMGAIAQAEAATKIKMTSPKVAAEIIIDGMEKNKYRVLIGSDTRTMDALYRLMPERAAKIIYNQMRSLL